MNIYIAWTTSPNSLMIFSGLAISTAGSPGRRPTISCGIGLPVTSSQARSTSSTVAPVPRAEVVGPSHAGLKGLDCPLMCLGEIGSVDIVSHTTSIAGWIVVAINQNLGPAADSHLENEWNQMAFVATILAKVTVGIGTRRR